MIFHKQESFWIGEFVLKFLTRVFCVGISKEQGAVLAGTWAWALVQTLVHGEGFKGALAVTGTDISKC